MLASLLNKKSPVDQQKRYYNWKFLLALPAWVAVSYFAAQCIVVAFFWAMEWLGLSLTDYLSQTILQTVLASLVYAVSLVIILGGPWLVLKRKTTLEILGLDRLMNWTDLGLAPLAFIVYGLALTTVMYIITSLFPAFPANEVQDVGFKTISRQYEYGLAFLTLVVLAPIVEEAIFRGYLYGKLRKHVPVYAAAIATSLLFALAHGQWNIAVDTFILGLFLVGLREITGSIWAGIVLHMIKNGIAFFWIFVAPLMLLR